MEAYLYAFVNWEQNDWAWLLPMAEFAYNNFKNASISHTLFQLNYSYYPRVSFEDKCNAYSRFSSADRLVVELRELINVCCQNLLHVQNF